MVQSPFFKVAEKLEKAIWDRFTHELDVMRFKRAADGILNLLSSAHAAPCFWYCGILGGHCPGLAHQFLLSRSDCNVTHLRLNARDPSRFRWFEKINRLSNERAGRC